MTLLSLFAILLTATPQADVGLPGGFAIDESTSAWLQAVLIIIATFLLEDPTCVAVGLLVRSGLVEPVLGIVSAMVGIFLGDLGLYALGHFGGRQCDHGAGSDAGSRLRDSIACNVGSTRMAGPQSSPVDSCPEHGFPSTS